MGDDGQKKILTVDDDPGIRSALAMILEPAGYQVVTAENGVQALEKAASESPDLILLDVMMPEMDGFAACAKLKSSPDTQDIPVVLLTGVADHITDSKYPIDGVMRAEADEYLPKPFDNEKVLSVVADLLGGGA
jgi:two-component system alkaline phosphatase synthesis response regulator PhoP